MLKVLMLLFSNVSSRFQVKNLLLRKMSAATSALCIIAYFDNAVLVDIVPLDWHCPNSILQCYYWPFFQFEIIHESCLRSFNYSFSVNILCVGFNCFTVCILEGSLWQRFCSNITQVKHLMRVKLLVAFRTDDSVGFPLKEYDMG